MALLKRYRVRVDTAGPPMLAFQGGLNAGQYVKAGSTKSAYDINLGSPPLNTNQNDRNREILVESMMALASLRFSYT